jgi:hypothetical protein
MMSMTRFIPFYYIYVDDYFSICIDQSGMIDITDASPNLLSRVCESAMAALHDDVNFIKLCGLYLMLF